MFTSNYSKNLENSIEKLSKDNASPYSTYFHPQKQGTLVRNDLEGDHELTKYYTFDELGHIMVASTSKNNDVPNPDLLEAFQKVIVFYGAWTAAFNAAGKTLFDYDAVTSVIAKSGFFINTQKQQRSFNSTSTSVSLNTQIIQNVLSGGVSGGGLAIAKRTLAAIGNQINVSFNKQETKKEICHLLFVVESLLGMPIISASIFHTTLDQMNWVQKTNCSEVAHSSITFKFSGDDYLFVDPTIINKYSPDFVQSPEYTKLIDTLKGYIPK